MSGVITRSWTVAKKIKHYLFECPTFWSIKPKFKCPICGKKYRCYWDGNDEGGYTDVCHSCCAKLKGQPLEGTHDSDCAVHNEPAYRNGECDCKELQDKRAELGE